MVTTSLAVDTVRLQTRRAVAFVLLSGVLNSFSGLIFRHIEGASDWQIVFYRTGALSLGLLVFLFVRSGRRWLGDFIRIGAWGLVCGAFFCVMQTMFVFSLSNTTVANTAFMLSSGPVLTAILARVVLGERVGRGTWVMLLLALSGIGLMVGDGLMTGNIMGDLAALVGASSFACFVVILRARHSVDMIPSVVIGGLMATIIAFLSTGIDLAVPLRDAGLTVFWGGLSAMVLLFFTLASRYLMGAVLTILLMIEYFLGPFWVWLLIDEAPSALALVGGAVVMSGVVGQAYLSMRVAKRRPAA